MLRSTFVSCPVLLHRQEDRLAVTDGIGGHTAVLITPSKLCAAVLAHDGTLAIIHPPRLPHPPVSVSNWISVQPVPVPGLGAPTHANPQVLHAAALGLENLLIGLCLELGGGDTDQLQRLVMAVLNRIGPADRLFSNEQNLRTQDATPVICYPVQKGHRGDKLELEGISNKSGRGVMASGLLTTLQDRSPVAMTRFQLHLDEIIVHRVEAEQLKSLVYRKTHFKCPAFITTE